MLSPLWQDTEIRCAKLDMETSDVPVTNLRKFFKPSKKKNFLRKSVAFGKLGHHLSPGL